MKGGYQLIDLSSVTVGTQATIAGIYNRAKGNNGKPFMIKTPDGQSVFAEVKAGTNKYLTAYLGADGSTYTVQISNQNKVDITKNESGAETDARLDAVEADIETLQKVGVSGTYVTVADQTSTLPVTYTCPSDGYIRHYNNSLPSAGNVQTLLAEKSGTNSGCVIGELSSTTATGGVSTYVRKGQKILVAAGSTALTGGSFNIRFYPFEA